MSLHISPISPPTRRAHRSRALPLALQANLEYRQLRDKLQDLEKEIAAKKAEEQALPNAQNADREIAELERTIGKERIEIANANGSLDTVRSRLEGTKKELRDGKYRHIDDEHRKKLIECKTTQVDPPAPRLGLRPLGLARGANTRCLPPLSPPDPRGPLALAIVRCLPPHRSWPSRTWTATTRRSTAR